MLLLLPPALTIGFCPLTPPSLLTAVFWRLGVCAALCSGHAASGCDAALSTAPELLRPAQTHRGTGRGDNHRRTQGSLFPLSLSLIPTEALFCSPTDLVHEHTHTHTLSVQPSLQFYHTDLHSPPSHLFNTKQLMQHHQINWTAIKTLKLTSGGVMVPLWLWNVLETPCMHNNEKTNKTTLL